MKLFFRLALLLSIITTGLNAQTVNGFNTDSVYLGKPNTSGTVIRGSRFWLPNITTGLATDNLLSIRNGRVYNVPSANFVTTADLNGYVKLNPVSPQSGSISVGLVESFGLNTRNAITFDNNTSGGTSQSILYKYASGYDNLSYAPSSRVLGWTGNFNMTGVPNVNNNTYFFRATGGNGANSSASGTAIGQNGSTFDIKAGNGGTANGSGTNISGIGGEIILIAGDGGNSIGGASNIFSKGGDATLQAGTSLGSSGGGNTFIKAGNSNTGIGGNVYLINGWGSGGVSNDTNAGAVILNATESVIRGQTLIGKLAGDNNRIDRLQVNGTISASPATLSNQVIIKSQIDAGQTIGANTTGNSATATVLQTPRTINGIPFDGSANITLPTGGTVTNVSSANANITVANPTTTPVLTLASTITSNTTGNAGSATTWGGNTANFSVEAGAIDALLGFESGVAKYVGATKTKAFLNTTLDDAVKAGSTTTLGATFGGEMTFNRSNTTADGNSILINNNTVGSSGIQYKNQNITNGYNWQTFISADDTPKFKIGQSNLGDYLTILSTSGNVGIGTTTPTARLEVNGNISASDGNQKLIYDILENYGTSLKINSNADLPLLLQNNGVTTLTISGGNVSASGKLNVASNDGSPTGVVRNTDLTLQKVTDGGNVTTASIFASGFQMSGALGNSFRINNSGGGPRWGISTENTESSGDVGFDFKIDAYSNGNSYLYSPLKIKRSTGVVDFYQSISVASISGSPALYSNGGVSGSGFSLQWANVSMFVVNNSLTTAQTSASLNALYAGVDVGYVVVAPNVGTGMEYRKVNNTGGGQWRAVASTTI